MLCHILTYWNTFSPTIFAIHLSACGMHISLTMNNSIMLYQYNSDEIWDLKLAVSMVPLRDLKLHWKTLGEYLQWYHALNHMCNQSKWWARHHGWAVVDKVHRSSTWVKVQIRIVKYYSSKSKSTAFSILLEWKYKSTQFFMYLSKKVLIDRFILQFYIDYFI